MISKAIDSLKKREDLEEGVVESIFDLMLEGRLSEDETGEFLKLLAQKNETAEEIKSAASALLKHADTLDVDMDLLDTCGTGGDKKSTFNISTASAIVCSLFVPVAKHGNKAVRSKSGSADVLDALGIRVDRKKGDAYDFLLKKNFTFLFAPNYHPAMRYVAPVRKKLGIRTVFNLIGPLCNPFKPKFQVIGVFSKDFLPTLFEAGKMLSMDNVIFLSSKDGLDEVSISDRTVCYSRKNGVERVFEFDPKELGIYADISSIKGYDAKKNAELMIEVFDNKHENLKNAVSINAAFALFVSGVEDNLKDAFVLAKESIENGKAKEKLEDLRSE